MEQRTAVEIDHKMSRGRLLLPVRAALAHYLMRWMRVDINPEAVDPEQIQIVLLNKEAVAQCQAALKAKTRTLIERACVAILQSPSMPDAD